MKDRDKEKLRKILPIEQDPKAYQMTVGSLIKALLRQSVNLPIFTDSDKSVTDIIYTEDGITLITKKLD